MEPDLVMTLMTPPVNRPYSALYPPVMTSVSWMNSLGRLVVSRPKPGSVVLMPSTMYVFSTEVEPPSAVP